MKKTTPLFRRLLASWQLVALLTLAGGAAFAAAPTAFDSSNNDSDILGVAHDTDPQLVNPWGIAVSPEGNLHVSDDATGVATRYSPDGALLSGTKILVTGTTAPHAILIPQAAMSTGTTGSPTGVDTNLVGILSTTSTSDFPIMSGTVTRSSHYLYCTQDGAIEGYNEDVNSDSAVIGADESTGPKPAGYTGIALSWADVTTGTVTTLEHHLYAANFAQGKIDVFDNQFNLLTLSGASFVDQNPPALSGPGVKWSPFNIHRDDYKGKDGKTQRFLLVVYAEHTTAAPLNDVTGAGYAALYDTEGTFQMHLNFGAGHLDSPWGIAVAHGGLGKLAAPLVIFVGNHGNGEIHAFALDPKYPDLNKDLGVLMNDQGNPLAFDGLWALHFGTEKITLADYLADPADLKEDKNDFYFSAGILGETHGLLGRIFIQPPKHKL